MTLRESTITTLPAWRLRSPGRKRNRDGPEHVAPRVFVDTSAWYPLASRKHPDHSRISQALKTRLVAGAVVVTTNLVLAETHALLMCRFGSAIAIAFLREARLPPIEVVYSSAELEREA